MTRSAHNGSSRRKAFNTLVRQKAYQEGMTFNPALGKVDLPVGIKADSSSARHDRHPGRTGMQWNSSSFISSRAVDDGELVIRDEDVYDFRIDFDLIEDTSESNTPHHTDMNVSLLDIARPAKPRGTPKDFEVVQKVRNVIALEDNDLECQWEQWEDDEWEEIYDERRAEEQRSYSSVLRGNET